MASIIIPDYIQQSTQKQQVLWYLDRYGSITSLEAIDAFTLTRLAAIIQFLEEDGYVFDPRPETSPDTGKSYARYYPLGGPGVDNGQLGLGLGARR